MNGRNRGRSVLAVALVCAIAAPAPARAQAADFTVVAIPDTQYYACGSDCSSSRGLFEEQMEWIADKRDDRSIRFVVSLGDCVENPDRRDEYEVADEAYEVLEDAVSTEFPEGIPYTITVGNHDQLPWGDPGDISSVSRTDDRDQGSTTEEFNDTFGVDRFCPGGVCRSYYGGHFGTNNDNHYELFEANGYRFVVVSVEYMPYDTDLREAVLEWADDVLTKHSDRRAIVVTHHVMDTGTGASFSSLGEALYDELKDHPNLFLMLGGHLPGEGRRSDTYDGRTVHTMLADYQGRNNGGDGWLRLLEFQPDRDRIKVRTWSPHRDRYETDSSSEFSLDVDLRQGFPDPIASFQQGVEGYTGASDTSLEDLVAPDQLGEWIGWDDDPSTVALLRFSRLFEAEGGPIPAGAAIRSATLHYVADDGGADADVHELRHPWGPGMAFATLGATPGAQPGEDYVAAPVGRAPGAVRHATRAHTVDVTASVAAWATNPASNQGWVFVASGAGGVRIRSSDYPDPRDRPRLSVTFVPDPCAADADCGDGAVCTADACVDGACRNVEILECCAADAECADDDVCTVDTCDPLDHTCASEPVEECVNPD